MILAVQGSKNFNDYSIFLSGMGTAMFRFNMDKEDNQIFIYTAGPRRINEMATEFANVSERGLRARGIRIQVRKIPPSWINENMGFIDYFAYFCIPSDVSPKIINIAKENGVRTEVYRY